MLFEKIEGFSAQKTQILNVSYFKPLMKFKKTIDF